MPQRSRRTSPSRAPPHSPAAMASGRRRRIRRKARPATQVHEPPAHRPADLGKRADRCGLRLRDRVWPAAAAAAMLGVSTGMVIAGLTAKLQVTFGESADSGSTVVGAAMLALAVGVRVPHRFAVSVCTAAWRRFVNWGTASQLSGALIRPGAPDRALYWLVLAVIALIAGVSSALLPLGLSATAAAYGGMHARFLWSATPLAVLQILTAFIAGLIPLAALGLSISCTHHLCCRLAQWDAGASAWVLAGSAVGMLLANQVTVSAVAADLSLVAASLPALVVSIGAAFLGSSGGAPVAGPVESAPTALPLWSDRWPTLLRASIVAVGGGSACVVFVWGVHPEAEVHRFGAHSATWLIAALAIGLLVGARTPRPAARSIGGFGAACNAAGLMVALGAPAFPSSRAMSAAALLLACGGSAAIGFAVAYGRQTLLMRVASRSSAGAVELGRLLVCAAFTWLVGAPLAVRLFGPTAALMMLALSLVALGGTLIIHEPVGPPRTRRVRLWGLSLSLATMIVLSLLPRTNSPTPAAGISARPTTPSTDTAANGR